MCCRGSSGGPLPTDSASPDREFRDTRLPLAFGPKGMGCWFFAPAVVFLMNLACSSQSQHNATLSGARRTLRMAEGPRMCPPGKYLTPADCHNITEECKCAPCKSGTFQEESTLEIQCPRCSRCLPRYGMITVRNCTDTQDAECACEPDRYKIVDHIGERSRFTCKRCQNCSSLNRSTKKHCSEEADAECGDCLPGFCPSKGKSCQPCPSTTTRQLFSTPGHPSKKHATFASTSSVILEATSVLGHVEPKAKGNKREPPEVGTCGKDCKAALISCGFLLVVLVACFVLYLKRSRWTNVHFPGDVESKMLPEQSCFAPPAPLPEPAVPKKDAFSHGSSLQQGRKLYAIIDAVPVRRWKEFVRGLGLRDAEIELVEVEYPQFREQQYEMLKCWCQKKRASVGTVFAVLEEMQLGGCAQELREQLQFSHPLRSP